MAFGRTFVVASGQNAIAKLAAAEWVVRLRLQARATVASSVATMFAAYIDLVARFAAGDVLAVAVHHVYVSMAAATWLLNHIRTVGARSIVAGMQHIGVATVALFRARLDTNKGGSAARDGCILYSLATGTHSVLEGGFHALATRSGVAHLLAKMLTTRELAVANVTTNMVTFWVIRMATSGTTSEVASVLRT